MPLIIPKTLPAYDALMKKTSLSCTGSGRWRSISVRWKF